jgi:esterase/lipase superfamily enzyme
VLFRTGGPSGLCERPVPDALGAKGIPNRVDSWGPQWAHQWPTWRRMLPQYLHELIPVG